MNSADVTLPALGLVRDRSDDARHLAAALLELGAVPVVEGTGAELADGKFGHSGVDVLVVGLGDEFDFAMLDTLGPVRVVFDDLSISAGLSGWDRARWMRHLRAKILGAEVESPPWPAGASSIPPRGAPTVSPAALSPETHAADSDVLADLDEPFHDPTATPVASVEASARPFVASEDASVFRGGEFTIESEDNWSVDVGVEEIESSAVVDDMAVADDSMLIEMAGDWSSDASEPSVSSSDASESGLAGDVPPLVKPLAWSLETVEFVEEESSASKSEGEVASAGELRWQTPDEEAVSRPGQSEGVVGLDELLDALRRDEADVATAPVVARPGAFEASRASVPEVDSASQRAFDLSSLSLEPLEHERPLTGRAQFAVDADVSPTPAPPKAEAPAPKPLPERSANGPAAAWLLAAGEADVGRVTEFLDTLPPALAALVLLVRPASAPWMGASLSLDDSGRLPLVIGDEVMDIVGGRVVVMAPGERAGFNRNGQLTVQPGDHSLPEALGDWMTLRALAGRFGRDAGVIVFGRLRDEVLEGAIELARAGGQVWFESSVFDEPNAVVDAARAAGIAMRTGTPAELSDALVQLLRG
jgi:two-component system chemotaxis response regulator CheB/chemosensory pili system protein ChpB (putative protein-glutamate methylesterase)